MNVGCVMAIAQRMIDQEISNVNETISISLLVDHGKSFAKSGDATTNFVAVNGQVSIVTAVQFGQCELFAQLKVFVGFLNEKL